MEITLTQALAATTVEHLGSGADTYDLAAYREALTRAWLRHGLSEADHDAARVLTERVLAGREGRDEDGRSWAQVANLARESARHEADLRAHEEADLAAKVVALYDLACIAGES